MPYLLQFLQSLTVLAAAPLYAGVLTKASALLQSKHGPSILQPYRDLAKWLSKGSAISDQTSWIFQAAPYLAMAGYLVVSTIVPIITSNPLPLAFLGDLLGGAFVLALSSFVMSLAAYDTASPLGGLGASRTTWLGGLARRMPRAAALTLVGTLGIAALPPLNGFVDEWLVFQGLFQGFRIPSDVIGVVLVIAAATLALTGGMAINAFARAFGIPFLGMARSEEAAVANEVGQPVAGPALLAVACCFLAVGAPLVLTGLDRVVQATTGENIFAKLIVPGLTVIPAHTDFSAFSPTYLAVCLLAMLLVPALMVRSRTRVAKNRSVPVCAGGILRFRPRMQYTATTHANPVRVTFEGLYRPQVKLTRASDDPAGRSGPVHYHFQVTPLFERYLYQPIVRLVEAMARLVQPIQAGDVNLNLLYVFVTILIAYLVAVR